MNSLAHKPAEIVVTDAEEFLSRDGLTRKAGCAWYQLPTLCIKEIVDNAFDFPGASYHYDRESDEHVISDDGPGLGKKDVLRLFNIRRPMTSTKRWRRAGRGALGNGLRVACAAVRALEGIMTVTSRDGAFRVDFDEIGETQLSLVGPARETGTEIKVRIDGEVDREVIEASTIAPGAIHTGPANAWAFGMMQFRELTRQCGHMTERELAAQFGCDLGRDMPLAELDDKSIKAIHGRLKHRNTKNTTLPGMGEDALEHYFECCGYGEASGMVDIGGGGTVPATVEAWADATRCSGSSTDADVMGLWMNRTWSFTKPAGAYSGERGGCVELRQCGLQWLECKAPKAQYEIALAVTSSFFPMVSDGKAPDLGPFSDLIKKAVRRACKLAYEYAEVPEKPEKKSPPPPKPKRITIKEAAFSVMDDAVRHASDGFKNIVRVRQVFYSVRALIKERFPTVDELKDSYFGPDLLPEFVADHDVSHWPVVSYDARGSASFPHGGEKNIQLSTVGVSNLTSEPPDLEKIAAVLFIEKEQFGEIIGPVQNEYDLLLIEAKGQGTVAEKELMKWASESGLPVFVFSDCDIAGFQISNAIRNGTDRFPHPIETAQRIGLDLDDALALDLLPEPYTPERKHITWLENSDLPDEIKKFIRHHRIELNNLSTGQMRDLLRRKLTEAGIQKPMPSPETVMSGLHGMARFAIEEEFADELEARLAEVRHEFYLEHGGIMADFVEAVCAEVDKEALHAETNELLQTVCRSGTWHGALDHYVMQTKIISKHLERIKS